MLTSLSLFLVGSLVSCGDKDTVPEAALEFLDEEHLEQMEDAGLPIHRGSNPPDITGEFVADTLVVLHDDLDQSPTILPYEYTFEGQSGDELVMSSTNNYSDVKEGEGAFISGSGGCFTLYVDAEGVANGGACAYKAPYVYSGCLNDDGDIEDWTYGLIMVARDGDCAGVIDIGHRRIIGESDGLVEKL